MNNYRTSNIQKNDFVLFEHHFFNICKLLFYLFVHKKKKKNTITHFPSCTCTWCTYTNSHNLREKVVFKTCSIILIISSSFFAVSFHHNKSKSVSFILIKILFPLWGSGFTFKRRLSVPYNKSNKSCQKEIEIASLKLLPPFCLTVNRPHFHIFHHFTVIILLTFHWIV